MMTIDTALLIVLIIIMFINLNREMIMVKHYEPNDDNYIDTGILLDEIDALNKKITNLEKVINKQSKFTNMIENILEKSELQGDVE